MLDARGIGEAQTATESAKNGSGKPSGKGTVNNLDPSYLKKKSKLQVGCMLGNSISRNHTKEGSELLVIKYNTHKEVERIWESYQRR